MGMTRVGAALHGVAGVWLGSKVLGVSGNDAQQLLSASEVRSLFGRPFDGSRGDIAVAMNGDGHAQNAHVTGCTELSGSVWATFDRNVTGPVRVNYLLACAE